MDTVLESAFKVLNWLFVNIGTLGMFILTLFTVIYSRRMLSETTKTVKNAELTLHLNNKPEIITYFNNEGLHEIFFYIKNIGKSPAININIDLNLKSGKSLKLLHEYSPVKNGISTLAPDQVLRTYIDTTIGMMDDNKDFQVYDIRISYSDPDGKEYEDRYTLDNNMFKGTYVSETDIRKLTKAVEAITKELKNINKNS